MSLIISYGVDGWKILKFNILINTRMFQELRIF